MITVAALFTQGGGDPAVGLALLDIDIYLYQRTRTTGATVLVWNGVQPTEEVGGGLYTRTYIGENWNLYDYLGWAQYTGALALDSDFSLQGCPACQDPCCLGAGAEEVIYELTSDVDGTPIPDANIWVTTDVAGTNVIASGLTNALGTITFWLDVGTYYVWRFKTGWTFDNPDIEQVT